MKRNVGGLERPIRILLGVTLLCLAYFHVVSGNFAIAAYVVGAVALVTGLAGFCPAWTALGINTCHAKQLGPKTV
jgi:hypothetical protein